YKSPSHRSAGHRPNGAPIRPPPKSSGPRPHGDSMRPSFRPAGHRLHGPSMNPRRPTMNAQTITLLIWEGREKLAVPRTTLMTKVIGTVAALGT
nr:hypothetical protein [Tanacetum cinerariifolium]